MPIDKIDPNLCIGCGTCIDSCPMDVIRMDAESEKAVIRYQKDCMACCQCELDCPSGAIYVLPGKGTWAICSWG